MYRPHSSPGLSAFKPTKPPQRDGGRILDLLGFRRWRWLGVRHNGVEAAGLARPLQQSAFSYCNTTLWRGVVDAGCSGCLFCGYVSSRIRRVAASEKFTKTQAITPFNRGETQCGGGGMEDTPGCQPGNGNTLCEFESRPPHHFLLLSQPECRTRLLIACYRYRAWARQSVLTPLDWQGRRLFCAGLATSFQPDPLPKRLPGHAMFS